MVPVDAAGTGHSDGRGRAIPGPEALAIPGPEAPGWAPPPGPEALAAGRPRRPGCRLAASLADAKVAEKR